MKILQVYPYYPPAWEFGGVLRVVHQLSTSLVDRGHNVSVFTTDTYGTRGRIGNSDRIDVKGLDVRYFPNVSNWLARKYHFPLPVGYRSTLNSTIVDYDVVHIHGVPHLMAVGVARAGKRHGIPYIVTPHGTINQPNEERPPLPRRLFNRTFAEPILSNATLVTALTEDEVTRLEATEMTLQRVVRIPNGTDMEGLGGGDGDCFRKQHGLSDTRLIGFIGRLHEKKGLDIVIECADRFRDDSAISFVIIGPDDGYETALQEQITDRDLDNVSLLGYVSESEKRDALDAIDVFLHPSYSEGQPMAVMEACATGTPVVISDQCALPEIEESNAGTVIPPDQNATFQALQRIIDNSELRKTMGTNAYELIRTEFSWDSVIDKYESEYERAASSEER